MRGHVLLELRLVEEAGLLAERVDPDHGWQRRHRHVGLGAHDLRHHLADLIVHEGETTPVGRGVIGLERAFRRRERGHCANSFGVSRLRSARMPLNRCLAASRPSSKRGGFASGCDHSGCSVLAAVIARGTQADSHCWRSALLWSANSRSLVSSSNIAMVYRRSRSAKSYSAAPTIVGVTKSPLRGAACCTRWLRNSSPTSGSKTTLPAKIASHQSSVAVSCSATSRTPCQGGSLFQASMCAEPLKPGTSSVSVRLYSARSWAALIRCMLFTEIALLCMFVGARRLALANRYRPRPWSTCIQAPTLCSTNRTQFGFHCSNAFACLAASMFWLTCRTTLEL